MQFWKGSDFVSEVLGDFKKMLDDTEEMFVIVCDKLIRDKGEGDLKKIIYDIDFRVNSREKEIRKRIVEHLAVQPSVDMSTSLLLMSVVKDAERLGDYSKNLYEVTTFTGKPLDNQKFVELFDSIDEKILQLFKQTKTAFMNSDEKKAESVWEVEREVSETCDEILKKLVKSNYPSDETVSLTLTARYFKRITAHLTNIATSVAVPLSDLDYFDKKRNRA